MKTKLTQCHEIIEMEVPEIVHANNVISKKSNLSPGTAITCLGSYILSHSKGWH